MINKRSDGASELLVLEVVVVSSFGGALLERQMGNEIINETLAQEFLDIHDLIADALGGEDNVPPEISDRLDALYNSIIAWEIELMDASNRKDVA